MRPTLVLPHDLKRQRIDLLQWMRGDVPDIEFIPLFFWLLNGSCGPATGRFISSYDILTLMTLSVGLAIMAWDEWFGSCKLVSPSHLLCLTPNPPLLVHPEPKQSPPSPHPFSFARHSSHSSLSDRMHLPEPALRAVHHRSRRLRRLLSLHLGQVPMWMSRWLALAASRHLTSRRLLPMPTLRYSYRL